MNMIKMIIINLFALVNRFLQIGLFNLMGFFHSAQIK